MRVSRGAQWFRRNYVVRRSGEAIGADLGGSSKYSNENFEGRSGEGFHVNRNWTWVSRS
jgi:hypothetical protein